MRRKIAALALLLGLLVAGPLLAQTSTATTSPAMVTQTYTSNSGTDSSWFSGLMGGGATSFGSLMMGGPYRGTIAGSVTASYPDPTDAKTFLINGFNYQRPFQRTAK